MPVEPKNTYTNELKIKISSVDVTQPNSKMGRIVGGGWVESSMNLPGYFYLRFGDNYQELLKDFAPVLRLGAKVELFPVANGEGKEIPILTGELTGIETVVEHGKTTTVLRGFDNSIKMMRHRRTKRHSDKTASMIVDELATEDGLVVDLKGFEQSTLVYKSISQQNVTDWQFVTELAARNGMFVSFSGRGFLRFQKISKPLLAAVNIDFPDSPLILEVGGNSVKSCRIGITAADQYDGVKVRGWDIDINSEVEGVQVSVPDFADPYRGRDLKLPTEMIGVKADTYIETSTPYGSFQEAQKTAEVILEDASAVFAEVEVLVESGMPGLAAGETFELKGAAPQYNGKYTITNARHEYTSSGDYQTLVQATGRQVRTLYGLVSGANRSQDRIHGVVNAIVENIDDKLQQGRVKVLFPWLDGDYKSRWARTLQFGGKGGGVISPAVGDEVLVAFDRGDIDYPYVLGGLYGHDMLNIPSLHDTPLTTEPGHLNRQSLVSRDGHRLELLQSEVSDDGLPKHGVRLQTGDEMLTIFMDELKSEITVTSKAGKVETAKITVGSDGKISVNGKTDVSVTSDASISIKAPKVSIDGAVTITGPVTSVESLDTSIKSAATSLTGAITTITGDLTSITSAETIITGGTTIMFIPGPYKPFAEPL